MSNFQLLIPQLSLTCFLHIKCTKSTLGLHVALCSGRSPEVMVASMKSASTLYLWSDPSLAPALAKVVIGRHQSVSDQLLM